MDFQNRVEASAAGSPACPPRVMRAADSEVAKVRWRGFSGSGQMSTPPGVRPSELAAVGVACGVRAGVDMAETGLNDLERDVTCSASDNLRSMREIRIDIAEHGSKSREKYPHHPVHPDPVALTSPCECCGRLLHEAMEYEGGGHARGEGQKQPRKSGGRGSPPEAGPEGGD